MSYNSFSCLGSWKILLGLRYLACADLLGASALSSLRAPGASQFTTAVRSALNILLTYAHDDTPWAGAGSKCSSICTTPMVMALPPNVVLPVRVA